jgi:hypothetical protein
MVLMAGLLGLGNACHHGSGRANGTVNVSGYVNYARLPVAYDPVTGVPSPTLGTVPVVSAARGVIMNVFQLFYDVDSTGKSIQSWHLAGTTVTDEYGYYDFSGLVYAGYPTFVEVASIFQLGSGNVSTVKIIADPAGINSPLPEPQRPIWAFRQDVAGTVVTNPVAPDATSPTNNVAIPTVDITLNFALGASDTWVATMPTWYVPGSNPNYPATSNQGQAAPTATVPLGSEVLGILDNVYIFAAWFGDPTPSQVRGGVLDLHYYPGRTEYPRRSYVVYDRSATPLADTGTTDATGAEKFAFFGTLAGGGTANTQPAVDDGWDPGAIYPLLARNFLFGQGGTALLPTGQSSTASLAPDLATVDGLGDAMAATLVTTPWLTDTSSTAVPRTFRNISAIPPNLGIGSPAAIAAAAWKLTLKAYQITPPGTFAAWNAAIAPNPTAMLRFYNLIYPTIPVLTMGPTTINQVFDIPSIYAQVGRLLEPKQPTDPLDLAPIFDAYPLELTTMMQPYGIVWSGLPYPTGWTPIAADWDTTTPVNQPPVLLANLPPFTLSMADAQKVTPVPGQGPAVYPNNSQGEVAYARVAATYDMTLNLSIATASALPATATIEVMVDPAIAPSLQPAYLKPQGPFLFTAGNLGPVAFSLQGNPTNVTNPTWHWIRIRMVSPAVQQPDVQVTVTLTQ